MSLKNTVLAITMTSIDSSTVGATYAAINSSGLTQACFLVRVINASTKDVTISYDGTTDNDYVIAANTLQLPLQSNSPVNNLAANFRFGTKVYVKGTAGVGNIYLVGYYQPYGIGG